MSIEFLVRKNLNGELPPNQFAELFVKGAFLSRLSIPLNAVDWSIPPMKRLCFHAGLTLVLLSLVNQGLGSVSKLLFL